MQSFRSSSHELLNVHIFALLDDEQKGKDKIKANQFGGVPGVTAMIIGLPLSLFYLSYCLTQNHDSGTLLNPFTIEFYHYIIGIHIQLITTHYHIILILVCYLLFQASLAIMLPSRIVSGTPVGVNQDGSIKRLDYKLNGLMAYLLTFIAYYIICYHYHTIPSTFLADNFTLLLVASNILSFIIAIGVSILAYQQNNYQFISQNLMYDFWMGYSRNPRLYNFDLKFFFEGRPGLMLWILLNISFIEKQKQNFDGHYSLSIIIINIFQILFVTDYYYFEEAILTTWDIMEEKFGLMMIWGDIVFVPFFFSIQIHYLSLHSPSIQILSTSYLVFCLCLCISGFLLFRIANLQKHHFSHDSSYVLGLSCYNYFLKRLFGMNRCNMPKYIRTKRGPKILYSGCWGIARRMNLTGDILQSIGWCLLCSFNHFIPYTYIIYLIVCFMHRERRDNEVCQRKFGSDWNRYTNIVQWRFFPNIY
ncbi:unnamed protein product [Rotaria socialis]|uniref:Delta(14)-sterol reductase n=1 Tax=Rotaria socialis TaxID=392032 RepID=A0A818D5L5_9BILA|nr:unnamed protein product [Rotaria socialis]CAF3437909.1 unnamed protein product [Rotaria socialis]CAF4317501.1 unnamed protein product [Rotaria socialis]CAF4399959.1 unnamed protein product [Rotaria socialis]